MAMQKNRSLSLSRLGHSALTAMLGFVSAQSVSGAVISSGGETTLGSAATFPTSTLGTDGWGLYQTALTSNTNGNTGGTDKFSSTLPTYVTAANVNTAVLNTRYAGNTSVTYSELTVGGTTYFTGLYYNTSTPKGSLTTSPIFAATLSTNASSIPHEFQLGLMTDNGGSIANDPGSFVVYDNYGTASATSITVTDPDTAFQVNDFYLIDITGAAAGDVLSVYATGGSSGRVSLAGYTFDTIQSTPEPGSLALAGAAALVLMARRRRSDATNHSCP